MCIYIYIRQIFKSHWTLQNLLLHQPANICVKLLSIFTTGRRACSDTLRLIQIDTDTDIDTDLQMHEGK